MRKLLIALLLLGTVAMAGEKSVYDFTMKSIDGEPTPLSKYQGKVVLLVNVASRCGFTPQYAALEKIYEKYKDQGFVIVGIPANNFGGQEPGSDQIRHDRRPQWPNLPKRCGADSLRPHT